MPKKAAAKNSKKKKEEEEEDEVEQEEEEKPKPKKGGRGKKAAAKEKEEKDEGEEEEKPKKGRKRASKADDEDGDADEKPAKKTKTATASAPKVVVDAAYFASPAKTEGQLKIVSWNVAGFKAVLGKDFLGYLKNEDPDIICLQETKITEEAALANKLPAHYHSYFFTCNYNAGYAGVGLMSKIKPMSVQRGIGKAEHDNDGRVLTAEYDKFYLVSVYVPNSGRKLDRLDYRTKEWDVDFLAYLKKLEATKPVIWCGDLNVAHQPIDLKNPKTNKKTAGFTDAERESFTKMLAAGFVDSFRHFYPNKEHAFWSYMGGNRDKDVGWRLDYFVVSKDFMPNVADSLIRSPILGSDHCPIMLLLKSL